MGFARKATIFSYLNLSKRNRREHMKMKRHLMRLRASKCQILSAKDSKLSLVKLPAKKMEDFMAKLTRSSRKIDSKRPAAKRR